MDVKPVIRTNVDGTFILREPSVKNRKSLWENYAGIIPDFSTFCTIMDQITDDYTALYIHNTTQSNKLKYHKIKSSHFCYRKNDDELNMLNKIHEYLTLMSTLPSSNEGISNSFIEPENLPSFSSTKYALYFILFFLR